MGRLWIALKGSNGLSLKNNRKRRHQKVVRFIHFGLYDVKSGKTTVLSDDNCIFVVKSPKSKSGDVRITEEYAWYDEDGVLVDASSKEDIIMPDDKMLISQLTNEEGTVSDYLKVIPLGTSKAKMMEIELAKSPYRLVETTNLVDKDGQTSILHICNEALHICNATFDVNPLRKVTIESNNTFSY